MSIGRPELLWLLLLAPVAATAAALFWRRRLRAAGGWAARGLWDRLLPGYDRRRLGVSVALLALAVLATAFALAQPRWGHGEQEVERHGIDVVLVVDSSLSMAAGDVAPSRLFVAKALLHRLLREMPQNRVGLVESEGSGAVLAPLTFDSGAVELLLDTIEPGSLPTPGTELAPALDQALRLFPEGEKKHRLLLLVSDGEDHGGGLEARIDRLAEAGVVVDCLGVGTPNGAPVPVPGGSPGELKRYQGKVVISQLDESTLESLARGTGGIYLRVTSPAVDLAPLRASMAAIETKTLEREKVTARQERFQWPLVLGVVALLGLLGGGAFRPRAEAVP